MHFFLSKKVDQTLFGQYPDDRIEKENISIFVDKFTTMFVIGVFQGNAKIKLRNSNVEKNIACHINQKVNF